jgi:hypothetical protein
MADSLSQELCARPTIASVPIDVAPGELLDKITILEIKRERINDPAKLGNILHELNVLAESRERTIPLSDELNPLIHELKAVNEAIWEAEDQVRDCERRQDFSQPFIEVARSVYRHNDRRAAIKRRINEHLGSVILEEKGYRAYELPRHDAA